MHTPWPGLTRPSHVLGRRRYIKTRVPGTSPGKRERLSGGLISMARAAPFLLLAACVVPTEPASPAIPYTCLLPSEQRMLVAELFFGRNVRGRGPVTEAEWAEFAAQVVTPNFPDGFTAFDGHGQWQNPTTRQ